MEEILGRVIDFNEKSINFDALFTVCFSYFFILWFVISLWVGVDAWRRFNSRTVGVAFFLMTLFLNFPILFFYFIIRPEFKYEEYEDWDAGGVSVPVVNFVGKQGVEMVLELKINPSKILSEVKPDMKVDVSWDSSNKDMELEQSKVESNKEKDEAKEKGKSKTSEKTKVTNVFSVWGGLVSKRIKRIRFFPPRKQKTEKGKKEKKDTNLEKKNKSNKDRSEKSKESKKK